MWVTGTMRVFLLSMAIVLAGLQLIWWELRAAAKAHRLTAAFAALGSLPPTDPGWGPSPGAHSAAGTPRTATGSGADAEETDAQLRLGFALPWTRTWVTADAAQVFTGALLYSAVASMIGGLSLPRVHWAAACVGVGVGGGGGGGMRAPVTWASAPAPAEASGDAAARRACGPRHACAAELQAPSPPPLPSPFPAKHICWQALGRCCSASP